MRNEMEISTAFFAGKRAAFYGDSITYGAYTAPADPCPASRVEKRWCDTVAEELGFSSADNYSQSGISVSSTSSVLPEYALTKRYSRIRPDAEVIFLAVGTNDFGTDVRLGNEDDGTDVSFCGGMNVLCSGLKKNYPGAVFFWILPIDRQTAGANKLGVPLEAYREKIRSVAGEKYGFTILDGSTFGFRAADPVFREAYMLDGVHPNEEGHLLYARAVLNVLRDFRSGAE